jgi:DNA processing protein
VLVAEEIAAGLASAGLSIVSGLARGVDGAAHRGALRTTGRTVAVLGCGADLIYPAEHQALAATITAAGVIVSELPPGARPLAHHFPLRNRIVSGLSRAVVVIEASEKSGSLITARLALEQGRDVLAVPGNVLSGVSAGCHRLIKDGARLVENVRDVLEELGWAPAPGHGGTDVNKPIRMSELERQMAAGESYNLDELTAHDPARAADVLAELTRLELAGRVRRLPGGHFVRMGG